MVGPVGVERRVRELFESIVRETETRPKFSEDSEGLALGEGPLAREQKRRNDKDQSTSGVAWSIHGDKIRLGAFGSEA